MQQETTEATTSAYHARLMRDRGTAATLRRCKDEQEIQLHREYYDFLEVLEHQGFTMHDTARQRAAFLLRLLVHVRRHDPSHIGSRCRLMLPPKQNDHRVRSVLRRERLDENTFHEFKSLIRLLHDQINVDELTRLIMYWRSQDDPNRLRIAQDYYA